MINALSFMNTPENMPHNLNIGRGIPLYMKILTVFTLPFCFLYSIKELIPIRWKQHELISTPSGENSGKTKFYKSKYYNFDELRICYKRFPGITFNKYMMGIVSQSIHHWYQKNGVQPTGDILTIMPVMMKPLVSNVKDLVMDNCTSGITYHFPLREKLGDAIEANNKKYNSYFNIYHLMYVVHFLKSFMFLPNAIGRLFYHLA